MHIFQSLKRLRSFSSRWWFPWAVASLSALNMFTLVLSAPITVLFLAAVMARPAHSHEMAFINALGVSIGAAAMLLVMQVNGTQYVPEAFPGIFDGEHWQNTQTLC